MAVTIKLTILKCDKCGWEWVPRKTKPPMQCPGCKTTAWQKAAHARF